MLLRELTITGAWEITPTQHVDDRGSFLEWYRFDRLAEAIGHPFDLRQANTSVSKRGVVRGIHFADVPRGQAKYVTVPHGAVIDFVVDVRVGSPTFGRWDAVRLDDVDRRALYIAEGLGHAFVALSDDTVVSYLVSDLYNPTAEHALNPLDPVVALAIPNELGDPIVSNKDLMAPTLNEAMAVGILPIWSDVRAYTNSLGRG